MLCLRPPSVDLYLILAFLHSVNARFWSFRVFRSDGFLPPTWTKKACSKGPPTASLSPFKSGTVCDLLFSENLIKISRKTTQQYRKRTFFFFFLLDTHFSPTSSVFSYPSGSLFLGSVLVFSFFSFFFLEDVLLRFCTGTRNKCCLSVPLSAGRGCTEEDGQPYPEEGSSLLPF